MILDAKEGLNDEQAQAVEATDGPVLILAGAGSGKTRTLTHRIAHLVLEEKAQPEEILAVTFTNKAAGEMKERLTKLLGHRATQEAWVMTFHSLCLKIARQSGAGIGLPQNFSVADPEDSRRIIHSILSKAATRKVKMAEVREVASRISWQKNNLGSISALKATGIRDDFFIAHVWERYEKELEKNVMVDFDNLLKIAMRILDTPQGETEWSQRFKYLLVDEFQDSNDLQLELLKKLAPHRNLCVVGDDDQSIYAFRNAKVDHILNFQKNWPGCTVVKLESNYRSSGHIIEAANAVIQKNTSRSDKRLKAELPPGAPVRLMKAETPGHEANMVIDRVLQLRERGANLAQIAIIYRTNQQSRPFEEILNRKRIPYRVIGGEPFFARTEIKAARGWLELMANPADNLAFSRAVVHPKRGIGPATLSTLESWAAANRMTLLRSAIYADQIPEIKTAQADELKSFAALLDELRSGMHPSVRHLLVSILKRSGLAESYHLQGKEGQAAYENLLTLVESAKRYDELGLQEGLKQMVESMKMDRLDRHKGSDDAVTLITFHSTKGLEFPYCFIVGLHDETFIRDNAETEVEEARRLFYVGITRAIKALWLSYSKTRITGTETIPVKPLRFLNDLPTSVVPVIDQYQQTGPSARATTRV